MDKKIADINRNLSNENHHPNQKGIFYILEISIKDIENEYESLLNLIMD